MPLPSQSSDSAGGSLLPQPLRRDTSRILALDAIRQIAALIVLIQHFFMIFEIPVPPWISGGPFDPKAAVTLFFVLSGYVLALGLRKEPPSFRGYFYFEIRRVLRLYPLHIAALLVSLLILSLILAHGGFSKPAVIHPDFLQAKGAELKQWLLQLTLIAPGMRSTFANPPVWTLMTEMKVSIIFPIFAWAILRSSPRIACVIVLALILCSDFLDRYVLGTFALLGEFALGVLLARLPADSLTRFNQKHWLAWTLLSLILYSLVTFRFRVPSEWIAYYAGAFGSAGIITAAIRWDTLNQKLTAIQKVLRVDISYGLYILHFPIMLGLRKLSNESVTFGSAWLLFASALLLTVGLSVALLFLLEIPAINLGKRLTRISPRNGERSLQAPAS